LLIEKKEKEKEENENKKIEEENNNNNKDNNNITESEKNESNNDTKNIIEKEKENERIIKRDNNKKDTNKEEINEDNIKETITDIIKKTINKKKTREKKEDNNDKINKTMNSASCKDIRIKIPKINKDKLKLNFNFINSIHNNFEESRNNDDIYITKEHRSFARPKNNNNIINNINSPIKKMIENDTRKYNSYRKKRDIITDLPIKNIIEDENEAKKYYTYRKKNNNDDLIDQPMEEKKGRLQNYRNRSKSNKKTEKSETVIINIPENIVKSRSVKKSKLKKQKKHHRHHHFYHFKKPQRIVAISNIDSFSIMNFNS
jgi:hypothetical protein